MQAPDWLPPTANPLTPYLTVSGADVALAFYERAFGFKRGEFAMKDDKGETVHGELYYHGRSVAMVAPEGAWGGTSRTPKHSGISLPLNFYVYCQDVDALAASARSAGATILRPPEDMFWGDRTAMIEDPDGYLWMFATKKGEFDPSKIPKAPAAP